MGRIGLVHRRDQRRGSPPRTGPDAFQNGKFLRGTMGRWIFRAILGKSRKAQERFRYKRSSLEAEYRGEKFPSNEWRRRRERSRVDVEDIEYACSSVQYSSRKIKGENILSAASVVPSSSDTLSPGAGSSSSSFRTAELSSPISSSPSSRRDDASLSPSKSTTASAAVVWGGGWQCRASGVSSGFPPYKMRFCYQ